MIKVSKARKFVFILSILLIVCGIYFYTVNKFNLGVDFESGVSINIKVFDPECDISKVRSALSDITPSVRVQKGGNEVDNLYILRSAAPDEEARAKVESDINSSLAAAFNKSSDAAGYEIVSSSFIGSKFSSSLISTSLIAVAVALVLILIYIWFRFQLSYSIAAVLTLIHDILLLLGFIIVAKIEISSVTIAAILTIIGYSLNNTIVIFDRVRENISLKSAKELDCIINKSVTQSLTRTLFSSLTTLAVIIPLGIFIINGDIKMFSLVLTTGIIIGIYSSTLIAGNLLALIARGKVESLEKKAK